MVKKSENPKYEVSVPIILKKGGIKMKKIAVFVVIAFFSWMGIAAADSTSDRVAELEKKLSDMSGMMQAIQEEIVVLKGKETEGAKPAAASASLQKAQGGWAEHVSLSGRVRFRGYDLENMWDFSDDQDGDNWNMFRTYGSLKATVKFTEDVTAVVKVANQNYGDGVSTKYGQELDNISSKIFLDNAYVYVRNLFGSPLNLTVGRQNLTYGSGFVIFDGNSQFASTNQYFDGLKLSYNFNPEIVLDVFYMNDEENNRDNKSDDDIHFSGVYFTAARTPVFGKAELYVLNRYDETLEKNIWTLGGRLSNKLENGFDYSLEGAYQTGDALAGVDQEAWGTKTEAGYTFKTAAMTPRVYAGMTYLSGDDLSTGKNEGWDVMYGGWPQFGDLMAWMFVNIGDGSALGGVYNYNRLSSTGGEAVFGNFRMATLGGSFAPAKDFTVSASYSSMAFNETYAGVDNDFGDYYQTTLKYQYNKQLSFSVYGALLAPGDALAATGMDNASELYWETRFDF
jgi:hypothetical protein